MEEESCQDAKTSFSFSIFPFRAEEPALDGHASLFWKVTLLSSDISAAPKVTFPTLLSHDATPAGEPQP